MERRLGVAGDPFQDLGVGRDARSRGDLAVVERFECGLAEDVPRDVDRLDPFAPVLVGRQVVEAERGVLRRIGALDPDRAARVRVHRPDMHLVAVALHRRRPVVTDRDRQEVEHQVRVRDVVVAAGEAAALEVVRGARPAPEEEPLETDPRPVPPQLGRRHGDGLPAAVLDVHLEVVLEVLADARDVGDDVDAVPPQLLGIAAGPPAVRDRPGRGPRRARDPGRRRPAGRRRAAPGPSRGLHPARPKEPVSMRAARELWRPGRSSAPMAVPPPRPGRDEPLRGRRLRPQQRRRRLPQPDVPLPAARDPLRRRRRGEGPRLPGPRRADVLGRPRLRADRRTDPHEHPAIRFNYLSTDQDRREWVEAIRVARTSSPSPRSSRSTTARSRRDRRGRATRRSSTGWPAMPRPRCIRRAPRGWAPTSVRRRSRDDGRPRDRRAAGRRRSHVPVRHERQHLRAGDDGGREGRRPDRRQHATAAGDGCRSTATRERQPTSRWAPRGPAFSSGPSRRPTRCSTPSPAQRSRGCGKPTTDALQEPHSGALPDGCRARPRGPRTTRWRADSLVCLPLWDGCARTSGDAGHRLGRSGAGLGDP